MRSASKKTNAPPPDYTPGAVCERDGIAHLRIKARPVKGGIVSKRFKLLVKRVRKSILSRFHPGNYMLAYRELRNRARGVAM